MNIAMRILIGAVLLLASTASTGLAGGKPANSPCKADKSCRSKVCVKPPESKFGACCQPTTCAEESAQCGTIDDGCGGIGSCGDCSVGDVCSGHTCWSVPTPFTCTIRFRLADTVEMGCLQFAADYSDASGFFPGVNNSVQCAKLLSGVLLAKNDFDDLQILGLGFVSDTGNPFTGPTDLAQCTFESTISPTTENFAISGIDACDINAEPLPFPAVVIQSIDCVGN